MSLFPYYGGKGHLVRLYPRPHFDTIVEPFAGGANYALKYPSRRVVLYDVDEQLVAVWQWLQRVTVDHLLSLPVLHARTVLDDRSWSCDEERWFMGLWAQPGSGSTSAGTVSTRGEARWPSSQRQVAGMLERVRHWEIHHGRYDAAPDVEATWFVDPPYQGGEAGAGGDRYRHGRDGIDFAALGEWCRTLPGQVIACDHEDATWLPFKPLSHQHKQTNDEWRTELVWLAGPQPMTARLGAAQDRGRVTVYHY